MWEEWLVKAASQHLLEDLMIRDGQQYEELRALEDKGETNGHKYSQLDKPHNVRTSTILSDELTFQVILGDYFHLHPKSSCADGR